MQEYNFTFFDELDALCCDCVPFEEPDIKDDYKKGAEVSMTKKPGQTWLARVVEEGKGGEDGGSDQPRLRSVLEAPPQHLQLGHLVRVELQQLKEVEEELGNEKLVSSQL